MFAVSCNDSGCGCDSSTTWSSQTICCRCKYGQVYFVPWVMFIKLICASFLTVHKTSFTLPKQLFFQALGSYEQNMKREDQQDATIRCLLLTSVSTCFGHHYAHLQENKGPVTAFGVLFWFCWMWLVAVVGRYLVGCEHYATIRCLLLTSVSTCFGHHYAHLPENKGPVTAVGVLRWFW